MKILYLISCHSSIALTRLAQYVQITRTGKASATRKKAWKKYKLLPNTYLWCSYFLVIPSMSLRTADPRSNLLVLTRSTSSDPPVISLIQIAGLDIPAIDYRRWCICIGSTAPGHLEETTSGIECDTCHGACESARQTVLVRATAYR